VTALKLEGTKLNWTEIPDLTAVGLLACAFASVARRSPTLVSGIWLTGWIMILVHFAAFLFLPFPGIYGYLADVVGTSALVWAGVLFMWSAVPYHPESTSRWMMMALIGANTLYIAVAAAGPEASWVLTPAAILLGIIPGLIAVLALSKFSHPLRWMTVVLYAGLSVFLLLVQHRPVDGADLATDAVLFTVYFGCCIHFWFRYRRATTGAFITIAGLLAWAMVFVASPVMAAYWPSVTVESEVWNLPKYVVAVGMILLLLEDQIEHNLHLALHDHLTGLPNRRLFQDRLGSALERARRTESQAALLVVDLDHFKKVNDTFGHHIGDLLLNRIGAILSGRVRRSDTVARTGGDEFSLILEEPTSRRDAMLVVQSLTQLLREPMELGGHTLHVGASVGIAVFPEDADDLESLCIAADQRMYEAKNDSRGLDRPSALMS
jgi:diguanylate cyclase (GGDEF)-like protein